MKLFHTVRRWLLSGPVSTELRLTVVPNEVEADLLCSRLRHEGIKCAHRMTPYAAGMGEGIPMMAGPREIIVRATDLPAARKLLAGFEHEEPRR